MSSITVGECPKCHADLEYKESFPEGGFLFWECSCPKCKWKGREWYDLKFDGFTDKNGFSIRLHE